MSQWPQLSTPRANFWWWKRPSTAKRSGTSLRHLEADETLIQAAQRELWEETGIHARPQHFIRLHQWIAPDKTPFIRFLFAIELNETCATEPHDSDIDRCLWVDADTILNATHLRSPLVAESIRSYLTGQRLPLETIGEFNWPFTEGVNAGGA